MTTTEPINQTVKVGDVFVESWGYDQTNVNWYQVVAVTPSGKSVRIREIYSQSSKRPGGSGVTYVEPALNHFKRSFRLEGNGAFDAELPSAKVGALKRLSWYRGRPSINLTSYSDGYLWDGQPEYETEVGWGH